jgi:hypothetical protein
MGRILLASISSELKTQNKCLNRIMIRVEHQVVQEFIVALAKQDKLFNICLFFFPSFNN